MAPYPEEIDVFSVPHYRMKQLVDVYCEKLTCTDFTDNLSLKTLLQELHNTFCEFKSHEQIENKYIMRKLRQRLKSLSIHEAAVCNCHSDSRLSDMLALLEDGYSCSSKPESERINFGLKLQNALQEFTGVFLPHMKEEEEVFQPMLMKYFEYEELKCLKKQVIQEHNKCCMFDFDFEKIILNDVESQKYERDKGKSEEKSFSLPPEILSHIFSFLSLPELLKCSEVCHSWYNVSRNPVLWKTIYPCYWAHGIFHHYDTNPEDITEKLYPQIPGQPVRYPNNEDFWDGEDFCMSTDTKEEYPTENVALESIIKFLLPKVGIGVQKIILSCCKSLTTSQLREILILCPNVVYLDASYTTITDSSFKNLKDHKACLRLQHLNLSGCKHISDMGLYRLADMLAALPPSLPDGSDDLREVYLRNCDPVNNSCPCGPIQEIEDSGLIFQQSQRNVYQDYSASFLSTPICMWRRDGFMCHLARQTQKCPYVNSCSFLDAFDIAKVTNDILRTNVRSRNDEQVLSDNFSDCQTECTEMRPTSLVYLNFSGCHEITDDGLRFLVEAGLFETLEFLDVSGCWQLTGPGLCSMVELAPRLCPENIYYCNQIEDGPYPETANGCQNLESDIRVCCCYRQS